MNWTGGRLQQHSKSRLNKTTKIQKEHFAKERAKVQNSLDATVSRHPETLISEPRKRWTEEANSRPYNESHVSFTFDAKRLTARDSCDRSDGDAAVNVERSHQSHIFKSLSLSRRNHVDIGKPQASRSSPSIPSNQEGKSFEMTKHTLLGRSDWSGVATAKPLRFRFKHLGKQPKIGRRRNFSCSDNLIPTQRPKGTKDLQQKENPSPQIYGKLNMGDHNDGVGRTGGHRMNVRSELQMISSLASTPTRSQSNVSTGSLLLKKYDKLLEARSEVLATHDNPPVKHRENAKGDRCSQPPVLPLNVVGGRTSSDEARQRTAQYVNEYVAISTTTLLPQGEEEEANIRSQKDIYDVQEGAKYHQYSDPGNHPVLSHEKPRQQSLVSQDDGFAPWKTQFGCEIAEGILGLASFLEEDHSIDIKSPAHQLRIEYQALESLQQRKQEPNEEAFQPRREPDESCAIFTEETNVPKVSSPTVPQRASITSSTQTADHSSASVAKKTCKAYLSLPFILNQTNANSQHSITKCNEPLFQYHANKISQNDCEAWVKEALAEDYQTVRNNFELPPTPICRKRKWAAHLQRIPMKTYDCVHGAREAGHDYGAESIGGFTFSEPRQTIGFSRNFSQSSHLPYVTARSVYQSTTPIMPDRTRDESNNPIPDPLSRRTAAKGGSELIHNSGFWDFEARHSSHDLKLPPLWKSTEWREMNKPQSTLESMKDRAAMTNRKPLNSVHRDPEYLPSPAEQDLSSEVRMRPGVDSISKVTPRTLPVYTEQPTRGLLFSDPRVFSSPGHATFAIKTPTLFNSIVDNDWMSSSARCNTLSTVNKDFLQADLRSSPGIINRRQATRVDQWQSDSVQLLDVASSSFLPMV